MRYLRGKFYFLRQLSRLGSTSFAFIQNLGDVGVGRNGVVIVVVGDDVVFIIVVQVDRGIINFKGVLVFDSFRQILGFCLR
jgi:hypothetical protein